MILEFGSDFYSLSRNYYTGCASLPQIYGDITLLADGRQGLIQIVRQEGWTRLWIPEYYCYEVLKSIEQHTGVELVYYKDFPRFHTAVDELPLRDGDAILRMNYFGLREDDYRGIVNVPVVEDHSHDVLSRWALYSRADWCFASLRKTLPIAGGGMVWSPKGNHLEHVPASTDENECFAAKRWRAMDLKAEYVAGNPVEKDIFRSLYVQTEKELDGLELSTIDYRSREVVENLDINKWYNAKKHNWYVLADAFTGKVEFLRPEDESCTPFSMVLEFDSEHRRETARRSMIAEGIYPAVLWRVPEWCSEQVRSMSGRLLSVHCDGRYSEEEMVVLANKIAKILEEL